MLPFRDRRESGVRLGQLLLSEIGLQPEAVVLGLPRGGMPVAVEVAVALGAGVDVMLVRKLGLPGHEELAMGAVASGGVMVLNADVVSRFGVESEAVQEAVRRERAEIARRESLYRQGRPPFDVTGRLAVLVDDGLATGATMRAAVGAVRLLGPNRVVVAVPVAAMRVVKDLASEADQVVVLATPPRFRAVGQWYVDFSQTTDEEVRDLLGGCA